MVEQRGGNARYDGTHPLRSAGYAAARLRWSAVAHEGELAQPVKEDFTKEQEKEGKAYLATAAGKTALAHKYKGTEARLAYKFKELEETKNVTAYQAPAFAKSNEYKLAAKQAGYRSNQKNLKKVAAMAPTLEGTQELFKDTTVRHFIETHEGDYFTNCKEETQLNIMRYGAETIGPKRTLELIAHHRRGSGGSSTAYSVHDFLDRVAEEKRLQEAGGSHKV